MNFRSLSKLLVPGMALASGCSTAHDLLLVTPEVYASDRCWLDHRGNFAAFMVMGENGRAVVPYAISAKCLIQGYSNYGEATLLNLNAVSLSDTFGALSQRLHGATVSDNVATDQPTPHSESPVYYLEAELTRVPHPYKVVYAPKNIISLINTGSSFEELLSMSLKERRQFLANYRK